jgi:O-antigen/teichoic acid export membrane protein
MTAPSPVEQGEPTPSLRGSILKGAVWTVGALWATRALGVFSTAILARLLAPQDFGLIAMASVVTGLLNVMFTYGIDTALIQNAETTRADWDTAWTVRLIQGAVLSGLVVLLAPPTAKLYGEPRVTAIMLVLASGIFIAGFENIGVVAFRKELQFDRAFRYAVAKKIFQVGVTIPLAFVLRSYWALLVGTVAAQAFAAGLSYFIHPFRPRWSLSRVRGILGFSTRLALTNLAQYFTFEGERLIVGALTGARQTGLYSIANEVGNMPTTELAGSMTQAAFPGLVKLKHDGDRLRDAYLNYFGVVALYALPAGIGVALVARDLVPVMLGRQWMNAIPLLQLLAVAGAVRAVYGPAYHLLVVLGRLNKALLVCWLQAGAQMVLLVPVIGGFGLVGAAALNGVLAAATLVFCIAQAADCAAAAPRDHVAVLWRPLLASAAMAAVCTLVSRSIATPALSLFCTALAGGVSYSLVALALWLLSGRPHGPERHLLELIGPRLGIAP